MSTINITPDTGAQEHTPPHPDDPQKTASGSSQAPGGGSAPAQSQSDLTQGQEGYPGPRAGGEADKSGVPLSADQTPAAGDTDPDSTASSEETGQAGDLSATRQDPQKNKGNAWNG